MFIFSPCALTRGFYFFFVGPQCRKGQPLLMYKWQLTASFIGEICPASWQSWQAVDAQTVVWLETDNITISCIYNWNYIQSMNPHWQLFPLFLLLCHISHFVLINFNQGPWRWTVKNFSHLNPWEYVVVWNLWITPCSYLYWFIPLFETVDSKGMTMWILTD